MKYTISLHDALSSLRFSPPPNLIPIDGIGREILLPTGKKRFTGKQPGTLAHPITWKEYQSRVMTRDDYDTLFRHDDPFDAVGIVCGVNGWTCFDFDKCSSTSAIFELLDGLGIDEGYEWVVESGSRHGFHVWILSDPIPARHGLPAKRQGAGVFSAPGVGFDHLELRVERCQTLIPPSIHPSGNTYRFIHGSPSKAPEKIAWNKIIDTFFELTYAQPVFHALPKNQPTINTQETLFDKVKARIDVDAVFGEIGWTYSVDGVNYVGECPEHDSQSGTCLRWHIEDGFFYCFHEGCNKSGDIFHLISLFTKMKPFQALEWCVSRFCPDLQTLLQHESPPHPADLT
jgi:hypothetical protein